MQSVEIQKKVGMQSQKYIIESAMFKVDGQYINLQNTHTLSNDQVEASSS